MCVRRSMHAEVRPQHLNWSSPFSLYRQRLFALAYTDLAGSQSFWGFTHLCSPPHRRRQGYKHCTMASCFPRVLGTCTQAFTLERQVFLPTELSPQTHVQLSGFCLFVVTAVVCLLFLIKWQQNPYLGRNLCRTSLTAGTLSCPFAPG